MKNALAEVDAKLDPVDKSLLTLKKVAIGPTPETIRISSLISDLRSEVTLYKDQASSLSNQIALLAKKIEASTGSEKLGDASATSKEISDGPSFITVL